MGKTTGFLDYDRENNVEVLPKERIKSYEEFHIPLDLEPRQVQASRCMNCGVPFCQTPIGEGASSFGCPLNNHIPEWNDELYLGNFEQAFKRLSLTSPFPEFTGRVCPALCEKGCLVTLNSDPVTIRDNELFIIEKAFELGYVNNIVKEMSNGKKVCIIGSGVAGLSSADFLNKKGCEVTVFERDENFGGLLYYGIPNMKLDKKIVERRIDLMKAQGINFIANFNVDTKEKFDKLKQDFDAIVLTVGAKKARQFDEKSSKVDGISYAVDFLSDSTKNILSNGEFLNETTFAKDKNVIVVGGGDSGNDCVATAIRQGAKSVTQLEIMPKPCEKLEKTEFLDLKPTLKVDYGQEESCYQFKKDPRIFSTRVKSIEQENNRLIKAKLVSVKFENGKFVDEEDSERALDCDLMIIATGFVGVEDYVFSSACIEKSERGNISTNSYQTSDKKVFACGDCRTGQSLIVKAISDGLSCAKEIFKCLFNN